MAIAASVLRAVAVAGVCAVLGLVPATATAQEPARCGAPAAGIDSWQIAAPGEAALDAERLCTIIPWLDGFPAANIHSILVSRNGRLVFEHYRKGADELRGTALGEIAFGPQTLHDVRSVSKSAVSLLIGIALDTKMIASIDEPVYRHFPEFDDLRSPERDRITIRHLLTMSSGLEWDETLPYTDPANSEHRMVFSPDPYRFAWEQKPVRPAGELYTYNGGSTELLGRILEKVSGQRLEDFAQAALFAPLGITDFTWSRNPNDKAAAASGLRLRPRDMARLGQLVLDGGRWEGRQIVSEDWVRTSITPQINGSQIYFYGYQWWLGRSLVKQKEIVWAAAWGFGGQRVFVVPSLGLVVTMTAGLYKSPLQSWVPLAIFNRVLDATR